MNGDNWDIVRLSSKLWAVCDIYSGNILFSGSYRECEEYWMMVD